MAENFHYIAGVRVTSSPKKCHNVSAQPRSAVCHLSIPGEEDEGQ